MCGRYSHVSSWSDLARLYQIMDGLTPLNLPARYNIAPTQDVPIVRRSKDSENRELVTARWGLVPYWAKDIKVGYNLINARAETVHAKPSFSQAFKQRRCLIPADGFYEWMPLAGRRKQPYYITLPDDRPFAFAGLWESWTGPETDIIESCTIIVTAANDQLRAIHDRMPVILEPERFDTWLNTQASLPVTQTLFRPYEGEMVAFPVSQHVNAVRNDDPKCVEPVECDLGP